MVPSSWSLADASLTRPRTEPSTESEPPSLTTARHSTETPTSHETATSDPASSGESADAESTTPTAPCGHSDTTRITTSPVSTRGAVRFPTARSKRFRYQSNRSTLKLGFLCSLSSASEASSRASEDDASVNKLEGARPRLTSS